MFLTEIDPQFSFYTDFGDSGYGVKVMLASQFENVPNSVLSKIY